MSYDWLWTSRSRLYYYAFIVIAEFHTHTHIFLITLNSRLKLFKRVETLDFGVYPSTLSPALCQMLVYKATKVPELSLFEFTFCVTSRIMRDCIFFII